MNGGRTRFRLPARDAAVPCRLVLRAGTPARLAAALAAHYPHVPAAVWDARIAAGEVRNGAGAVLGPDDAVRAGNVVHYYRDLREAEPAHAETVLVREARVLVVDKPPGMPTTPAGRWYAQTLVHRLRRRLGEPGLTPLHRLDRLTAGLVLVSIDASTRASYQSLFRERRIAKAYVALAPPLPALTFPLLRESRLERDPDGRRMREVAGPANARTRIDVESRTGALWRYRLFPETGRTHQLRVHMAVLGAPIAGDPLYGTPPEACRAAAGGTAGSLGLVAAALAYVDPFDGQPRRFESRYRLDPPGSDGTLDNRSYVRVL